MPAFTVMPPPPVSERTPAFVSDTFPPSETAPPPARPLPAVTVMPELASWVLATVISRTAHTRLTDTTSGFRASGPRAIALFEKNYPAEYLGDTIESLVIACRAGLKVTQVPVAMRERSGGTPSQNPLRASLYLARASLALAFAYARPTVVLRDKTRISS